MTAQEEITDSPTDWVNKHVRQDLSTDDRQGHSFYGHDALFQVGAERFSAVARTATPVIILERTDD